MEKFVAGVGFMMSSFSLCAMFFFGIDFIWGVLLGLAGMGIGYIFCED